MKWGVRKDREAKGRRKRSALQKTEPSILDPHTEKHISTGRGDTTIIFDNDYDKSIDLEFVEYVRETYSGRYADESKNAELLNNLPRNIYASTTIKDPALLTNHGGPEGRQTNCFQCGMAYELRMRGYNAQSKPIEGGGWAPEVRHAFDVKDKFTIFTKPNDTSSSNSVSLAKECYRQLEEQCLMYGDGARGIIGFQYAEYNSGHCMSWEVNDGKFRLVNTQVDYLDADGYNIFTKADTQGTGVDVIRLDNADVLPGVMDFVEAYEMTEEEKEEARKEFTKKKHEVEEIREKRKEAKARLEYQKKNREVNERRKEAKARVEYQLEKQKTFVDKIVRSTKKVTNDLVKSGKAAIAKLLSVDLSVKTNVKVTTHSSGSTKSRG